ncbi:MAG: hypothetical protein CMP49_03235 [Flavobacteriales bacterium]|nr:hypothetical protein [Flavobacteriales bacterium]
MPLFLFSQNKYSKNNHVEIKTHISGGNYIFNYTYKDHFGQINHMNLSFNKNQTDQAINKLGIPYSLFDKYTFSGYSKEEVDRKKAIRQQEVDSICLYGLFVDRDDVLELDYNLIVSFYKPFFKIIANDLIEVLKKNNNDSKKNRIEITMKFIQDIPYGRPKRNKKKFKNGCFAPLEVLVKGYGDCDSKSLLFACILSHMIDSNDIVFVIEPDHLLAAVYYNESMTRDSRYFYSNGKRYYLCEVVGPARLDFGEEGKRRNGRKLIPLRIK